MVASEDVLTKVFVSECVSRDVLACVFVSGDDWVFVSRVVDERMLCLWRTRESICFDVGVWFEMRESMSVCLE